MAVPVRKRREQETTGDLGDLRAMHLHKPCRYAGCLEHGATALGDEDRGGLDGNAIHRLRSGAPFGRNGRGGRFHSRPQTDRIDRRIPQRHLDETQRRLRQRLILPIG